MNLLPQLLKTGQENGFVHKQYNDTNYNNNVDHKQKSKQSQVVKGRAVAWLPWLIGRPPNPIEEDVDKIKRL